MQAAQRAGLAEAFEGGVEERTLAGGWGFKWEGRQVLGARAWQRAGSHAALAGGSVAWSHACRRLSGSVSVSSGGGASSRILNEALVQRARASEKLHGDRLRPDGPPASPPSLRVPSAEGLGLDDRRPSGVLEPPIGGVTQRQQQRPGAARMHDVLRPGPGPRLAETS